MTTNTSATSAGASRTTIRQRGGRTNQRKTDTPPVSSRVSPPKLSMPGQTSALVTMLNELFSSFDKLAEKHGLEKIKTIGDAYMVVAGIPTPIADHAVAIAHMAIDMLAAVTAYSERTGTDLSIRIGIHTGSVVAGVIGTKKFIYDLWGDTVNTASRMESTGVPGRVQVTESTYRALRDLFELEERGPIEVKGKGQMSTYLLIGPREDPNRVSVSEIAGSGAAGSDAAGSDAAG